jgi:hypothetical protein
MKNQIVIGYSTNRSKTFQEEFNQQLLESVGLSPEKNEVVIIPYENHGTLSLTKTYNQIWQSAKVFNDAVFVFIHHDIYFRTKNWGRVLLDLFNGNQIDIVGVVGTEVLHQQCVWIMDQNFQFSCIDLWGKVWHIIDEVETLTDYTGYAKPTARCKELQPVVVIDGVFIAFNPETCSAFDEDFDGFHFYDVSFCVKNYLQGKRIAVTETIQLCHESAGDFNDAWQQNRVKFHEKYGSYLPLSI